MATFDIVSTLCEKCPCPCCHQKLTWAPQAPGPIRLHLYAHVKAKCLSCGITLGFWRNGADGMRYPGSRLVGGELMESWHETVRRWTAVVMNRYWYTCSGHEERKPGYST